MLEALEAIRAVLGEEFDIHHTTIQFEETACENGWYAVADCCSICSMVKNLNAGRSNQPGSVKVTSKVQIPEMDLILGFLLPWRAKHAVGSRLQAAT